MLKWSQLCRHQQFLTALAQASSAAQVRKLLQGAGHLKLRTLLLVVAAIYLKKIPVTEDTVTRLRLARKGKVLKAHFASWKKVKQLLATKVTGRWREILRQLAPLLRHCALPLVKKKSPSHVHQNLGAGDPVRLPAQDGATLPRAPAAT